MAQGLEEHAFDTWRYVEENSTHNHNLDTSTISFSNIFGQRTSLFSSSCRDFKKEVAVKSVNLGEGRVFRSSPHRFPNPRACVNIFPFLQVNNARDGRRRRACWLYKHLSTTFYCEENCCKKFLSFARWEEQFWKYNVVVWWLSLGPAWSVSFAVQSSHKSLFFYTEHREDPLSKWKISEALYYFPQVLQ